MKLIELKEEVDPNNVETNRLKYHYKTQNEAIELIHKNCTKQLNDLKHGNFYTRRDAFAERWFSFLDTSNSLRRSENTINIYTEILDTNPHAKDFPKRSKSLICRERSSIETKPDSNFLVIPYDNALVGKVHSDDMWDTEISLFGLSKQIEKMNYCIEKIGISVESKTSIIDQLKRIDENLKNEDKELYKTIIEIFPAFSVQDSKNFLDKIYEAYSPAKTKFTSSTASNAIPGHRRNEVWIQGQMIIVNFKSNTRDREYSDFVINLKNSIK